MIRTLFRSTTILGLALTLSACGDNRQRAAAPAAPESTTAASTPASGIAHGDALCDLIATHFAPILPANAERQAYPSGDMCKIGGSSPGQPHVAQVRVIVASRTGMTPAVLGSFRVAGHTIVDAPDLGEGAFIDTLSAATQAAKVNVVAEKAGHLITIEIEFARAITDSDSETAHTLARDFIAAL